MIGKIVKGTSFSECVNYVLKEDKSRLLKAVGVYDSPEEIAEQFELQTLLNDKVKNTVGHITQSCKSDLLTHNLHLLFQFSWQLGTHYTFRYSLIYHIICKYSGFSLFYDGLQESIFKFTLDVICFDYIIGH